MSDSFNPIVRSFGRYRAALGAAAGVPRGRVRPGTPLADLVPPERRRAVWAALRAEGLTVPALGLRPAAAWGLTVLVVAGLAGLGAGVGWWAAAVALVPAWVAAFRASRPWAVRLPPWVRTAGELAVYGTRFADHGGHRWSGPDVARKVRMVVAESLGLPLDRVRPESTLLELGAD